MSFDLFVDRFDAGRPIGASAQGFEQVFGPHVRERNAASTFFRLSFGENVGADCYLGDGACMFNHFGGDRFFALLFEYLSNTRSIAYWPGEGPSAAVVDPAVLRDLPVSMIKKLQPLVVHTAQDLVRAILG